MESKHISAIILGVIAACCAFAGENGFWGMVISAVGAATVLGGC